MDHCKVGWIAVLRLIDDDLAETGGERCTNSPGEVRVHKPFGYAQPYIVKIDQPFDPCALDDTASACFPSCGFPLCRVEPMFSSASSINHTCLPVETLEGQRLSFRKRWLHLPLALVGHQSRQRRTAGDAERGNEELPQEPVKCTDEARKQRRWQQAEQA